MPGRTSLREKLCILAVSMAITSVGSSDVAAAEERSGTIVAIDEATATLALRIGPSRMTEEDAPGFPSLQVALTPSTDIFIASRSANAASSGPGGDVVQMSSLAGALRPGMFATITCTQRGAALVADSVRVIAKPPLRDLAPPPAPSGAAVR